MKINEFKLERYFAKHEFTAKYLLSSSDCDGYELKYVLGSKKNYKYVLGNKIQYLNLFFVNYGSPHKKPLSLEKGLFKFSKLFMKKLISKRSSHKKYFLFLSSNRLL